jgi:hypothetical protein
MPDTVEITTTISTITITVEDAPPISVEVPSVNAITVTPVGMQGPPGTFATVDLGTFN